MVVAISYDIYNELVSIEVLIKMSRQQMYNKTGNDYIDSRYGSKHMKNYLDMRNETLYKIINNVSTPGRRLKVLEVGCGPGLSLEYLKDSLGSNELYGIDFSHTMLKVAQRSIAHKKRMGIALANAFELPFADNSFDCVFATRFIHQFNHEEKIQLIKEFSRVTNSKGILIIEFYYRLYHWFRYFVSPRERKKKSESYFLHYPNNLQVKEITGGDFKILPLRVAGSRLINSIFGYTVLKNMTKLTLIFPFKGLLDEYFVLIEKKQ